VILAREFPLAQTEFHPIESDGRNDFPVQLASWLSQTSQAVVNVLTMRTLDQTGGIAARRVVALMSNFTDRLATLRFDEGKSMNVLDAPVDP